MSEKIEILDELGETSLLLPEQVNRALGANDRIKYVMTLLQAAASQVDAPAATPPDLSIERIAAGVTESTFDRIPAESRRDGEAYRIPHADVLYAEMRDCLEAMLLPLQQPAAAAPTLDPSAFAERLLRLTPDGAIADDVVPVAWLARCTSAERSAGDSIHLLVMDLHRALNQLQTTIAPEQIDGAAVYNVIETDRPRIAAFMSGLNATAPLKFDHPGLDTTATRSGEALLIQNDLGTTDAPVLVVRVVGTAVSVTYTDVHAPRADFFESLFERFTARWTRAGERAPGWASTEESYVLLTGQYEATDLADLDRFLTFLGSRLVFLIDWNRARRALGDFVRNRDAIDLLTWGANQDFGHRALVQLGASELISNAIDQAAPEPLPYGRRLDAILGREATIDCLGSVLRITSEQLRAGRSERLIRDEVRSELARRFRSFEERLLGIAAEHAMIVGDLAAAARASVVAAASRADDPRVAGLTRRASVWERQADELVVEARRAESQASSTRFFGPLLSMQDDVADTLEDVVFLATLLASTEPAGTMEQSLRGIADLLVRGSRALVTCIATAEAVKRDGADQDTRDFLEAVDQVVTIEHEGDAANREFVALLAVHASDFRQQHILDQVTSAMEASIDAMAHTALALRDHLIDPGRGER